VPADDPIHSPATPDPALLTAFAKHRAHALGFQLVGVTGTEPPDHLDVFAKWLSEGGHGEMGYLAAPRARQRREDPRRILPECRSILVVGANYLPAELGEADGRVAAYAVGEDYHHVLPRRLERLVEDLSARVGRPIAHRIYTDTGPLLERELAQRAGLGWIGKNTCLIHPRHGSYFLLAEVLLDLELVPDPPFISDHCGSCTRCLEACPTQCIRPDRTLRADRCISYLTIELKGAIPRELRPPVGEWAFGCDICQQVCPWNVRFAEPTADPDFQPRPFLRQAGLEDFLRLDGEAYRSELRGSPLKRVRRAGLLRNAAVAAGNRRDPELVPALRSILLEEQSAMVRSHAAWALGRIGGPAARQALQEARRAEPDPGAKAEIEAALKQMG
jgi:epoxyqueuosine reductase